MGSSKFQFWPDQLLQVQIEGTIRKIDQEKDLNMRVGLEDLLARLLAERDRRAKRKT